VDERLQTQILELLDDRQNVYLTCYALYGPEQRLSGECTEKKTDKSVSSYHTSVTGLLVNVGASLDRGVDPDTQEGHYGNALQSASVRGYEKIVQMLFNRGADVNAKSRGFGNFALQIPNSRQLSLMNTLYGST